MEKIGLNEKFTVKEAEDILNKIKRDYGIIHDKYTGINGLFNKRMSNEETERLFGYAEILSSTNYSKLVNSGESKILDPLEIKELLYDLVFLNDRFGKRN